VCDDEPLARFLGGRGAVRRPAYPACDVRSHVASDDVEEVD